ncbi:toll-like receptor 2 [Diadema antillarum]|uniref:toll-like receptor 2 n=1 Tax=Diadema antillarum TaxID=105358 RepID=UPI003A8C5006
MQNQVLMLLTAALLSVPAKCQWSSSELDERTSRGVECSVCLCDWESGQKTLFCQTSNLNATEPFRNFPELPDVVSVEVYGDTLESSGPLAWPQNGDLVKHFPNVRSLEFSYCTFETIGKGFLDGLSDLQSLTFTENGLREIPMEALAPIAGFLRELNISDQRVGVLALAAVIFGVVVFIRLRRLRLMRGGFIFTGRGRLRPNRNDGQEDLVYDVLVYHHNDEVEFVDDRLRPRLENHPNNLRLCMPLIRDFRLGAKMLNSLRESLVASRCAVFVISEAFVLDARCKQALEVACDYLHRDDLGPPHIKQTGLILILLDPVLLETLPEVIRVLVDRLITLEWNNLDEERCWRRLEQSLHDFGRQAENEV